MAEPKEKVEEERKPKPKKPPGYRNFHKLLKQVIKSPPLHRETLSSGGQPDPARNQRGTANPS
jgi:hypothetical protein